MPNDERNDKNFQKRFGYFVASGTLDLITMWVYIFFLNAFLDIEKKYQPILGWVRYYWSWIISFIFDHIVYRSMPQAARFKFQIEILLNVLFFHLR